jgi:hypothetical protein
LLPSSLFNLVSVATICPPTSDDNNEEAAACTLQIYSRRRKKSTLSSDESLQLPIFFSTISRIISAISGCC